MGPCERFVRLPGEVEIAFSEQGAENGVPVLFLHGYADSWRSFQGVLEHMPESVHAFAVSLRGHGNSSQPAWGYGIDELATDVRQFMDAVGLTAAVLVGGSSGGFVARRFAIEQPARTLALVFLGSPFSLRDNPGAHQLLETVAKFEDPVPLNFVREFQESTLVRPVSPTFLDGVIAESAKVPARVWKATLAAILDDDTHDRLGQIRTPSLAIWGDRDATVARADQERLVAAIPGGRLIAYKGAGHALYWEEPARVAVDIVRFIESLAPTK